jgi:hypothetical protein
MNINNLNVMANQNLAFQAKIPQKALNIGCEYAGKSVKTSAEKLTSQLTKLKDKKMELENFIRKNSNNLEAKMQLDSLSSAML